MYEVDTVSLRQRQPRSRWLLTLWAILVNLLCVCPSQNELLLRTVAYPYPLSFNITQINGSSMTNVLSTTDNFYRTLTLHDGKLFVGGRSQLFSVSTENLSLDNDTVTGFPDSTNHVNNYVTVIQPIGANLLECGTHAVSNSGRPYCVIRSAQNLSDAGSLTEQNTDAFITGFTFDQNTSLLVDGIDGPNFHVYTGSKLDVNEPHLAKVLFQVGENGLDFTISKTLDSTNDNSYLDEPQFVGEPIDYNGRIYFFFREYAVEHINGGRIVFSRVARVCKNETGGKSFTNFEYKFVTFGKARLTCYVAGTYEFYYNDIQDVYQSNTDANVVYAIFTAERGVQSSALCAYRLDELDELFFSSQYRAPRDGQFGNLWAPVPVSDEPFTSREQHCPSVDTQTYSTMELLNIKTFTLLLDEVADNKLHYESKGSALSNPLLISTEERFSQIIVDNSNCTDSIDVFYVGTENGTVLKAYLNEDRSEALVVEEISLNTDGVKPVLTMVKSDTEQAVFVGTDSRVYKIPFVHCCDYILRNLSDAGDPYCKSIVTGDWQQDLSSCSGETMFETITIHKAPSDLTRATNITNQPVRAFLTAEAGRNLRFVGLDCVSCSTMQLYTNLSKSVSADGTEFLFVTIDASASNESMKYSISVALDNGVVETRSFAVAIDRSAKFNATEGELKEIACFDDNVASYQFRRDEWLKKVGEACELENVGICTEGDANCP
ncbi:semaphorin-2A-like [Asterias rubens]|uniref:semaphorin-2A-like n=1 Tax=Asterias rubens TaxID=7604 RepID=UPI001455BF72|nr:semaphorin-2A-like [Asterias rubens]XP_033634832.1 semaphorin-2A-like [Asterias rubens]XP_033634834.1 semaphorin-2A-like [Asterias rubens]